MNLGNIWTNFNNKNVNNTQKNKYAKNTSSNNVFQNIFTSKTGINKAHTALNSTTITNTGFSHFKKNKKNNKKYWGTPTWYMFHSIASKIDEQYYKINYIKVWNFIKDTCATLPCPYCRQHAIRYVNKITTNEINTKEKLKHVLFNFHNNVNKRNHRSLFLVKDLKKYDYANLNKIFSLFEARFFKSYYSTREFQDWAKTTYYKKFTLFIQETKNHYD
tara:strand:- start:6915 stop:7568 length:654 start_codon:yes stop_codon:yes gene_type:complete